MAGTRTGFRVFRTPGSGILGSQQLCDPAMTPAHTLTDPPRTDPAVAAVLIRGGRASGSAGRRMRMLFGDRL